MIHLYGNVPNSLIVACSGGPDSMAAVDFFRRGRKDVTIAHFDHGTEHGAHAREFVEEYAREYDIPFRLGAIRGDKPLDKSWEEWWRDQRLAFLKSLSRPVVTGHTLNDVAEWWIYTSMHGEPRLIPRENENIIRPFLLTEKSALIRWCETRSVPYVQDPSNFSGPHMRTVIRGVMMPNVYHINPGFNTVMRKRLLKLANSEDIQPVSPVQEPHQIDLFSERAGF